MIKTRWIPVLLSLLVALSLGACASGGGGGADRGPSDEEQIVMVLDGMLGALQSQDIDAMVAYYSDDFMSNQGQDKAATAQFLNAVKQQGFLEGIEVDQANRVIVVDGDTATVEGVGLSGAFGVLNLGFKLEKRDGNWVVVYQSQE